MAITRLGFAGHFMAYLGFQPKATQQLFNVSDTSVTSIESAFVRSIDAGFVRTVDSAFTRSLGDV